MENTVNQLVILGNGFDLNCGLHSKYDDFFHERFEKIDTDEVIDVLLNHKPNNNGSALNLKVYGIKDPKFRTFTNNPDPECNYEDKLTYFDLLFMATERYMGLDSSWSNVEQILQEVLHIMYDPNNQAGFDTSEEIAMKAVELKDTCFNNYKFNSEEDKIEFITFVLHIFNKTVEDKNIEKSLKKFEETFGRFISSQISDEYISKVDNELNKLIDEKADVLSFNYSATPLLDFQLRDNSKISEWYNVHGLARWDQLARKAAVRMVHDNSIKLPRPIFGISRYDQTKKEFLSVNDPIHHFTKGDRREEAIKEMPYNFLEYQISPEVNKVTVFGHSLGMTDYDYFKKIFQKLDLANSKLQLEIYYLNEVDRQNKIEALQQMFNEYGHDAAINSRDLYNKLVNEKRLVFKAIEK
ncbi:MAG: bacteriophage abortive infection AbiH family protein [Lactobacillus crispatus]|nr:bacteriophage abortive infection AbiH family protein [Lactobacillus crispatus]